MKIIWLPDTQIPIWLWNPDVQRMTEKEEETVWTNVCTGKKRVQMWGRFSLFDMISIIEKGRKYLSMVSLAGDLVTWCLISLELRRRSAVTPVCFSASIGLMPAASPWQWPHTLSTAKDIALGCCNVPENGNKEGGVWLSMWRTIIYAQHSTDVWSHGHEGSVFRSTSVLSLLS